MGSKGTVTSTATSGPDPIASAAYSSVIGSATALGQMPYSVAPVNTQQNAGISTINQAPGMINQVPSNVSNASDYVNQGANYINNAANPLTQGEIQYYENPWTQDVVNSTEAQFANTNAQALNQVTGNAAAQGALGGNRVGVAQAQTLGQLQTAQAPVIGSLEAQGYNTGLSAAQGQQVNLGVQGTNMMGAANTQLGAGNTLINASNAQLGVGNAQVGAGTLEQETQQAGYLSPYQTLSWQGGIDTGVGSNMGGTSSLTQPAPSVAQQVAGLGVGVGSLMGGAGILSDRRAKEKIHKIGETNDDQPIYRYKYKGSPEWHIGLIAQDVEKSHPEAVSSGGPNEYKMVDLKAATDDAIEKKRANGGFVAGFATGGSPIAMLIPGPLTGGQNYLGGTMTYGAGPPRPPSAQQQTSSLPNMSSIGNLFPKSNSSATTGLISGMLSSFPGAPTGAVDGAASDYAIYKYGGMVLPRHNRIELKRGGHVRTGYGLASFHRGSFADGGTPDFNDTFSQLPTPASPIAMNPQYLTAFGGGDAAPPAAPQPIAPQPIAPQPAAPVAGPDGNFGGGNTASTPPLAPSAPLGLVQTPGMSVSPQSGVPRGIRNNNPLNIEDGSFASSQPGYMGTEPQGRFATFATPEHGINAATNLLANYGSKGFNTVNGIVSRWAPSSDGNNVSAYANTVARQLGVDPDQPLNMKDPQVRTSLAMAMSKVESGGTGIGGNGGSKALGFAPEDAPPALGAIPAAAPAAASDPAADNRRRDMWTALAAAGFGMAASHSPFFGVAAGEGGLQGLNALGHMRAQELAESKEAADVKHRADQLSQAAKFEQDRIKHETEALAETSRYHGVEAGQKQQGLAIQQANLARENQQPVVIGDNYGMKIYGVRDPNNPGRFLDPVTNKPVDEAKTKGPESIDTTSKAIANYQMPPLNNRTLSTPWGQEVMARVYEQKPEYNAQDYSTSQKAYSAFATGKQGEQVKYFNNAVQHLNTMDNLVTALGNGDVKALNAVSNAFKDQFGYTAPGNFDAAKAIVGQEIVKAIVANGGGVPEREEAARTLSAAKSPEQLRGVINTYKELMGAQIRDIKLQYEHSTMRHDFESHLIPEAQAELAKVETRAKSTAAAPPGAPVAVNTPADAQKLATGTHYKTPDGKEYIR